MKKKEQNDYSSALISFRAPLVVQEQLGALQEVWGENKSQAIHRAISLAYEEEKREKLLWGDVDPLRHRRPLKS